MKRTTALGMILLALILNWAAVAIAQTTTARLQGTVTDTQGAVIAGATISVTNLGTGRVVTLTSSDTGDYSVPALPPGRYSVEVKQAGFSTYKQDVTLEVAQVAKLDVQLKLGAVAETVEVKSDLPLVDAASSNVSEVIVGKQITELPLNGRNFTQLALLVPGVTRGVADGQGTGAGNQAETFRYNNTGGGALSVNGLRPQNNNFLLDGVDNNESLVNTIIFFPPAESIQEFRVDTSVAPAEFGRAGGGVVNTSFRSGSNSWHGSVFEFLRNDDLDARRFFDAKFDASGKEIPKAEFKRHQFGGSAGGPIIKNRLFIFGDYQGLRQYLPLAIDRASVPTAKMRNGDFSELLRLATPIQIRNPITGLPLAGNLIPSNLIVKAGQNYLNAYPSPNITGNNVLCGQVNLDGVCIKQNYLAQRTQIQHFNDFNIRADLILTARDTVFGRYSYGKADEVTSSRLPALPAGFGSGLQKAYPRSAVVGETHTFGSSLINEFRFGWVHTEIGYTPPFQDKKISADLGIPNANTLSILGGGALIGGYNDQLEYSGDYGPYIVPEQTWQFSDSLSWVKNKHTFKFGATILRRQVNLFRPFAGKGYFFLFGNGGGQSPTGYEVSDVLAGFVDAYRVGPALGFSHTRNWETGYFVQDDWRVTNRLTLNLGLRYDLYTWPEEANNLQANFDIATGQLVLPGTSGYPKSLINTDTNNFAPRIGFAYDVFGKGKTILRGGFGMFYFLDRGGIDNQLAQNPPFSGLTSFSYSDGFRINLGGRAPNGSNDPTQAGTVPMPSKGPIAVNLTNPSNVDLISYPKNDRNSYVEQWNLQIQQQLGPNMGLTVGYVGNHGIDLMTLFSYNRQTYNARPGTRPFPSINNINLNTTIGSSNYHSLQARLQRRLSDGLQFTGSYTWSHTIDDSPGTLDQQVDRVDFFNFRHERANSNLDLRHRFVLSALYELPFGKGRKFGSTMNPVLEQIVGGWQINPILVLQSGMPFDVISSYQGLRTRPDLVGSKTQLNKITGWFDTTAFKDPPTVTFANGTVFARPGTAPRNPFTGPARHYMDMSIFKNFKISERITTQFRSEFFNLTNTPQFAQPSGDISSGDFGKVKNVGLGTERQIQFALRVTF